MRRRPKYEIELAAAGVLTYREGYKEHHCPGCGVMAEESTPGDLRCPKCARSLVEFVHSLIERHPHLDNSGKWT
jgi:predicted RNA-binding Zn-ribbon protein involved in translation (DUF1610 family)